ncbi:hypothetical protein KY290_012901 [Solanum tuberosum]|uniref:DUF4283 domain-containing protein n=1 Tax=Solanum tuberosum TaxID=4113 RepID=A0ABQ7VKW1_SOLTU|nr:hypothetical protein KY285_012656 [Solanum tuberosum]KAH0768920.1 hypothetical protein KY290_012901 [Solanum tuberosum]
MTTNMCTVIPPPKPPDPLKITFEEALLNKDRDLNLSCNHEGETPMCEDMQDAGPIFLSEDDKQRIYSPWKYSAIVKLYDLGWDFFIAKFNKQESMNKALHEGPWFVTGSFLLVRSWEPNFVPDDCLEYHTTIWTRLPQLPMDFYDREVRERIGRKLGRLLKIDSCTSATLRGRYARICLQDGSSPLHSLTLEASPIHTATTTTLPYAYTTYSLAGNYHGATIEVRANVTSINSSPTPQILEKKVSNLSNKQKITTNLAMATPSNPPLSLIFVPPPPDPVYLAHLVNEGLDHAKRRKWGKDRRGKHLIGVCHEGTLGIEGTFQVEKGKGPMTTPPLMSNMMNFIIWNVRCANSASFRSQCEPMVKLHKPVMLVLLETRLGEHKRLTKSCSLIPKFSQLLQGY